MWSWPWRGKSYEHAGSWPIVRSRPRGKFYGCSLPIFIRNMDHHLTTLDVYADGAFDCWQFVDRQLLKEEIRRGWLATAPSEGKVISIFNLGRAEVASADWTWRSSDIYPLAEQALRALNPTMSGLLDLEGSATEQVNGIVHSSKLGLADKKPYRVADDGVEHLGASLPMLIAVPDGTWQLEPWFIFADGSSRLGASAPLTPLDMAISAVRNGGANTAAPDLSWITLPGLGRFRASGGVWYVGLEARIAEARDELLKLQTGRGAHDVCREAFEKHQKAPSPETLEALRNAYFAVPEHLRCYCGDMDNRDWPIKEALGLEQRPW